MTDYQIYVGLFGFITALVYTLLFESQEKGKYFFVAIIYFLSIVNVLMGFYK